MLDKGWDKIFRKCAWGKYPSEEFIRFIARNFYNKRRKKIKILELGCGPGANIWYLSREGFDVYGIDGSNIAIKKAKKRLKKENLKATLILGDVINIPFKDNFFDLVFDIECLYSNSYLETKKILREVHRVLSPDGLFYSKTFSTKISGLKSAKKLRGEKDTYVSIPKGPLRKEYKIIRLMKESNIKKVYSIFRNLKWDSIVRTDSNKKKLIGEWIITGVKR